MFSRKYGIRDTFFKQLSEQKDNCNEINAADFRERRAFQLLRLSPVLSFHSRTCNDKSARKKRTAVEPDIIQMAERDAIVSSRVALRCHVGWLARRPPLSAADAGVAARLRTNRHTGCVAKHRNFVTHSCAENSISHGATTPASSACSRRRRRETPTFNEPLTPLPLIGRSLFSLK